MKIYKFSYHGLWLSGQIFVVSDCEENAYSVACETIENKDWIKGLTLDETLEIGQGFVIHNDNGDY